MKNDYPGELLLFSAITGAIIAPLKLLVHHIFLWMKLAKPFYMHVTAFLIHGQIKTTGFGEMIFAELGDVVIGAIFGMLLGLWLAASRSWYDWWIGLGFGFGIWFASLSFGVLTKIIKPDMTDNWSLFAHLLAMLTFGLLFVLASRFWKPLQKRLNNKYDE